jgi:tRNA A22 N-methylase
MRRQIASNPVYIQRDAKRLRTETLKQQKRSVYIVISCKDLNRSAYEKNNFDQAILGIYFSRSKANKFAKDHAAELRFEEDDENEEEDEDDEDEGTDLFSWSGEEECEDNSYEKVWVEERPIKDASSQFHN